MSSAQFVLGLIKRMPSPVVRMLAGKPLQIDGYTLNPNMQWLANLANRRKQPITDLNKYRKVVSDMFKMLNGPRRASVDVTDTRFTGPASELPIRIYRPDGVSDSAPAVLYFHQGGLVVLDLDTCDTFCTILASECRAQVISLDYRLCPEHDFPAPIDDALALWDHVQQHATDLGIDPNRVAVCGDSAGGLITSVVSQQLGDRGGVQPVAQVLIYPWVGTNQSATGSMASCAETFPLSREVLDYFGQQVFPDGVGADHPLANPLSAADLSGLPPAIVVTAGFDPLRDQGNAYAEKLRQAGVPVVHHCFGSLCHGFAGMGHLTQEADDANVQIARDLAGLI